MAGEITIVPNVANLTPADQEAFLSGYFGGTMEDLSWIRQTQGNRSIEVTGLNAAPDYGTTTAGTEIASQALTQGYTETMVSERYGLRVAIDGDADQKIDPSVMLDYMLSFADSGKRRYYESCFDVLNTCTATNRGDGVPLVSASHPSEVGLQSNSGSSALDHAAAAAADLNIRQTQGPDGQLLGLRSWGIMGPAALAQTIFQVTGAEFSLADDRRAVSYVKALGLMPIVSEYLGANNGGSDTRWFMLSMQSVMRGQLRIHTFRAPAPIVERMPNTVDSRQILDEVRWETGAPGGWRGLYSSSS